jgi:two-component system CheB/CheR fusion protein
LYSESIVAAVRVPLVVLDGSLRILSANPSFHRLFQVTPEEVENRLLFELGKGEWDVPRLQPLLAEVLSRNTEVTDFEANQTFDKLGQRTLLLNAREIPSPDGQPPLILLAIEDITERKQAEQELKTLNLTLEDRVASRTVEAERRAEELARSEQDLRAQQQLLQAILQSVHEGVVVTDKKGRFLVFNPAAVEFMGLGPAEIPPEEWQGHYGIFLSDQVTPCLVTEDPLVRAIQGEDLVEAQLFVKNANRPNGVWLSVVASPLRDRDGSVIGGVSVLRDITESKRAEDALRDSEERLRAIVTTAADAIVTIDEQGIIESCNPAAERMFAYTATEFTGRNIKTVMPSPYLQEHDDYLARYLITGDRRVIGIGRERTGRRKDGSTFPIDLAVSELHVGSRRLFTGIIRDISERKSLQQELLSIAEDEQRRIGQDLHDDIGQELTGLAMKAETLQEIVVERQIPESAFAAEIVAGVDRIRAKVRALSRGMVSLEVESNGLVSAFEELTARLGALHGVVCLFEGPERSVEIDSRTATQLYHIAQEAIANAIKHGHAHTIRVTLEIQESKLKLAIRDDGIGIPTEPARPDGMGLRIMSYRAGLIDGKLTITRDDSGGTLISCQTLLRLDEHVTHKTDRSRRK